MEDRCERVLVEKLVTKAGRADEHLLLSTSITCTAPLSSTKVVYFVFDKDPNVPQSYRNFAKYEVPCGGQPCQTLPQNYAVTHTQVAKIVSYFETSSGRSSDAELTMPYNERGVLYPIMHPDGFGGTPPKEVPFPEPPFFPCSSRLPTDNRCFPIDPNWRGNVIELYESSTWPLPVGRNGTVPSHWQAHHIHPLSWAEQSPGQRRRNSRWRSFAQI